MSSRYWCFSLLSHLQFITTIRIFLPCIQAKMQPFFKKLNLNMLYVWIIFKLHVHRVRFIKLDCFSVTCLEEKHSLEKGEEILTSFLSSTKQKLLNEILSRISFRESIHKPFYIWHYFLVAKVLIETIWGQYQKPILRTKSVMVQCRCAINIWRGSNVLNLKHFQNCTIPPWLHT